MSKSNYELRNAGDVVWIAFPKESHGDIYCSIFGPVTICESNLYVEQKKSQKPVVKATYRVNALVTAYIEEYIYDSFHEANESVHAQVASLRAKQAEHDALHSK